MSLKATTPSDELRTRLAHALGYHDYPASATAEPYLTYIVKSYGGEDVEDYLELFIAVVEHFKSGAAVTGGNDSIQALIDKLTLAGFRSVFVDTSAGDAMRRAHVEDIIMCIIGTWTTMLSSFQLKGRSRKVTAAYNIFANAVPSPKDPYEENVAGLILGSELCPGGQWDHRVDIGNDTTSKLVMLLSNATGATNQSSLQSLMQSTGQLQPLSNSTSSYHAVISEAKLVLT
jgi:hypothetical protein